MKRSLRWSILIAVLGFILGLGLLIPVGPEDRRPAFAESTAETAAWKDTQVNFIDPELEPDDGVGYPWKEFDYLFRAGINQTVVDHRGGVLFDIHTIAQGKMSKNVDAWVQLRFADSSKRDKIAYIKYCHNYDYGKLSADTSLNRYEVDASLKSFPCFKIDLAKLPVGKALITTDFGAVLKLQSNGFDPKSGGTLSLIFAYRVNVLTSNDERRMDLKVTLKNGIAKITGPNGEAFDWLNLKMYEFLKFPKGVDSFETFLNGKSVGTYDGDDFPEVPLVSRALPP